MMKCDHNDNRSNEVRVELKYCEHCGCASAAREWSIAITVRRKFRTCRFRRRSRARSCYRYDRTRLWKITVWNMKTTIWGMTIWSMKTKQSLRRREVWHERYRRVDCSRSGAAGSRNKWWISEAPTTG